MANTLIVDGNSIGHANHNGVKLTVGEMQTQAIFGVVKTIKALMEQYRGWDLIVLWDGRAQWRYDLYPGYKGNRGAKNEKELESKEAYRAQSSFIRKALQLLGVRQLLVSSAEADDMAGFLSKRISAAGNRVVLITGDKDWIQMVNEYVVWFDPIRDRTVNFSNFFESTGYHTPDQFVDGKALTGDGSDTISGVGGIGEKGAPEFIAEFRSVQAFYDLCDSGKFTPKKKAHVNLLGTCPFTKDEWAQKYEGDLLDKRAFEKYMDGWPGQGRLIFNRNRKLMNLLDVPKPSSEDVSVIAPTFNKAAFQILCEKLAFASILRNFDEFVAPFESQITLKEAA